MTWTRVTSGTLMARLTAAATWSGVVSRNLRVSRPWRNSAWGGAGRPATAARTLARTIAWRKSGTGCVAGAPGLLMMAAERGAATRGEEDGDGAGLGLGETLRLRVSTRCGGVWLAAEEGRMAGALALLSGAAVSEGLGAKTAQPARKRGIVTRMRRALPDMLRVLSSDQCSNQRQADPPLCFPERSLP